MNGEVGMLLSKRREHNDFYGTMVGTSRKKKKDVAKM